MCHHRRGNGKQCENTAHNMGLAQTNTQQAPSSFKFTDCQGHFVILCGNAAGREFPFRSHSAGLSPLSPDVTPWITVLQKKARHCAITKHSTALLVNSF